MSFILISKLGSLSSPQNGMSFHGQLYMYIRMLRLRASFYPKHSCYAFVQSVSEASLYTNAGIFYPPGTVHTVMFYVILNVHKTRSEYCIYYTAPARSPNNALHSSSYYLRVLFSYACCTIYSSLSVEVILLVIGMVGLGLSMLLGLITLVTFQRYICADVQHKMNQYVPHPL